jgi:thioredoxin 1
MDPSHDNMPAVAISEQNFDAEVLHSKQPVLVVFWAPWSRPCQILGLALEEVAVGCAGSVKVFKVNADDNPELSLWYGVQSIPTLLYFVDGSVRAKVVGTASKEAILARLRAVSHCGDSAPSASDVSHETI